MARSSQIVSDALRACRKERAEGYGQMYECLTEKVADARAARDIPNAAKFPTSIQAEIHQAARRHVGASARARKRRGLAGHCPTGIGRKRAPKRLRRRR